MISSLLSVATVIGSFIAVSVFGHLHFAEINKPLVEVFQSHLVLHSFN